MRDPEFTSLAMCASVVNISKSLVISPSSNPPHWDHTQLWYAKVGNTTATLEVGDQYAAVTNMSAPEVEEPKKGWPRHWTFAPGWGNEDDLQTATVAQLHILYNNFGAEDYIGIRAAEVLWHFCVKTHDARVDNATSLTTEKESTMRVHEMDRESGLYGSARFGLSSQGDNGTFNVRLSRASKDLNTGFRNAFGGPGGPHVGNSESLSFVFGLNLYADTDWLAIRIPLERLSEDEVERRIWSNLQKTANNMANTMRAFIRNADPDNHIEGKAYKQELHILIRWEWLSLLAIQLILTLVFLIWVMVLTAQLDMDVVKSSNIAELFAMHGVDESTGLADQGESVERLGKGINT
ncbi:hypothetical protein V2G26_004207 [Clonostachys chloroleuca]